MSETVHRNRFLNIHTDPERSAVTLEWTAATSDMSDADFQDSLCIFAIYAMRENARSLIVDARQFGHSMSDAIAGWRLKTIIPRYNDAGCQKFAFVLGDGAKLPPEKPAADGGPRYPTRFFETHEAAETWLG